MSLILLETDTSTLSRYVIIGSILSGSLLESFYFYLISENKSVKRIIQTNPISYTYLLPDFLLLSFVNYFIVIANIGTENLNERHVLIIVLIYLSWVYSALFTHRFNPIKQSVNNWAATGLQLKFYLLILSSTSLFVFALNIRPEYWRYFLISVTIYSISSFVMFLFLYVRKLPYPTDEVTNVFLKAFELAKPSEELHKISQGERYKFISNQPRESVVKQKCKYNTLRIFLKCLVFGT